MTLRALPAVLVLGLGCAQSRSSEGPAGPKPGIEPIPMPVQEQPAISYRVTGTTKYALHRRDSVTVQLPSGPTQAQIWGRTVYLRTTVEPAGAGATERRIEVVIDSIVLDQDVDFPKVMLDSATGTRWTGWFLPTGRLEDLVASKSSLVGEQIRNQLRLFFPVLPANGANLGSEWSDSTTSPVKVSAFEATEQALSRYRVAGFDIHAGTDVIRIDAARTSGLAASGSQFGQEMTLSGTGRGEVAYFVNPNGRLLSAEGTESSQVTVTVQSVGQQVPATQVARFTVKTLP